MKKRAIYKNNIKSASMDILPVFRQLSVPVPMNVVTTYVIFLGIGRTGYMDMKLTYHQSPGN